MSEGDNLIKYINFLFCECYYDVFPYQQLQLRKILFLR